MSALQWVQRLAPALFSLVVLSTAPTHVVAGPVYDEVSRSKVLNIGWAEWRPLEYRDTATGELKGFLIETAKILAVRAGLQAKFFEDNWSTMPSGVALGKFHLALMSESPARAQTVDFSHPLYYSVSTAIVDKSSPISTWSALNTKGHSIAVTTGSLADEVLSDMERKGDLKAELVRVKDVGGAFLALTSKKVDAFASQLDALLQITEQRPQYKVVDGHYTRSLFSVGIPKGDNQFKALINKAIVSMLEDKTMDKLLVDYKVLGNNAAEVKE